jgi:pyrimidine deaminase RibD-like protein
MTPQKRSQKNRFSPGAQVLVGMSRLLGTVLHVDDGPSILGEYVHRVRTENGELDTIGCDLELVPALQTNMESAGPSEEKYDRAYARLAIEEARKSAPEDKRIHPRVGVVIVKDGKVLASAHRGEIPECHAEYIALEKKLAEASLAGATVYTTLEPCTSRNHPKVPCATRLSERRVGRVVIGMLDPDNRISGRGQRALRKAGVATDFFPHDLMGEVEELNREFVRDRESRENGSPDVGSNAENTSAKPFGEYERQRQADSVVVTLRTDSGHQRNYTIYIKNHSKEFDISIKRISLWSDDQRVGEPVFRPEGENARCWDVAAARDLPINFDAGEVVATRLWLIAGAPSMTIYHDTNLLLGHFRSKIRVEVLYEVLGFEKQYDEIHKVQVDPINKMITRI